MDARLGRPRDFSTKDDEAGCHRLPGREGGYRTEWNDSAAIIGAGTRGMGGLNAGAVGGATRAGEE